jgi:hypothetical protein
MPPTKFKTKAAAEATKEFMRASPTAQRYHVHEPRTTSGYTDLETHMEPKARRETTYSNDEPDIIVECRTVRGSLTRGRRPHVCIDRVVYSNPRLANMSTAVESKLLLRIDENDMRAIRAQLESGEDLGILTAFGDWSRVPHSRAIRRSINNHLVRRMTTIPSARDQLNALPQHYVDEAKRSAEATTNTWVARQWPNRRVKLPQLSIASRA